MVAAKRQTQKTVRVFLSYSVRDKKIASVIKIHLESFKLVVFLAHEDISPSIEWQNTILKELKTCDIFIPILTTNFSDSEWTDQESGIALASDRIIVPLKIDINPYGFVAKYQALKINQDNYRLSCLEIIRTIYEHRKYRGAIRNCVIRAFAESYSFIDAAQKSNVLVELGDFTDTEINEIIHASSSNNQIHDSFKAKENLSILIKRYKDKIDKKVLRLYQNKIR